MISPYVIPGLDRKHHIHIYRKDAVKEDFDIAIKIMQMISLRYSVSNTELTGKTRTKEISFARHLAMYLISIRTKYSLKQIGSLFNVDHTSVVHAKMKIRNQMKVYPQIKIEIEQLADKI